MDQSFCKLASLLIVFQYGIPLNTKTSSIKACLNNGSNTDLIFKRHYNNDVNCFRDSTSASKSQFRHPFIPFQHGWFDIALNKRILWADAVIKFTLQLMQLKHISDPSVFKATNNAGEIRLNNSNRFVYMQHISDHHLGIYLIS